MSEPPSLFRIDVVLAPLGCDVAVKVIVEAIARCEDMLLVWVWDPEEQTKCDLFAEIAPERCTALLILGTPAETRPLARECRAENPHLVVLQWDLRHGDVELSHPNPSLQKCLDSLREMVGGRKPRAVEGTYEGWCGTSDACDPPIRKPDRDLPDACAPLDDGCDGDAPTYPPRSAPSPPLGNGNALRALLAWAEAVLREAVGSAGDEESAPDADAANAAFADALWYPEDPGEPLVVAHRAFALSAVELQLLGLALAAEIDPRRQRDVGLLLNDPAGRVGTVSLYTALLGLPLDVRNELATREGLRALGVFDDVGAGDEPLRVDPFLVRWLLGEPSALADDPRVRRVLRTRRWAGRELVRRATRRATRLVQALRGAHDPWVMLNGDDVAGWRALLELGARELRVRPIRVEAVRLAAADPPVVEECARRIGRCGRLSGNPIVFDLARRAADVDDELAAAFLAALARTGCIAAVLGPDRSRLVRALGATRFRAWTEPALSIETRTSAVRVAARIARADISEAEATALVHRHPLDVEQLDRAARLARAGRKADDHADDRLVRFTASCRLVATEDLSGLAERIESVVDLDDVVLPADRKEQLLEITDNVRFASRVLDEWEFGSQLSYGRGVTALFFGPSGTGKTLAALAIAHELGMQLVRVDLSKVVSKYIGDTEKNLDRVFADAQRSGSAVLLDECDGLMAKRSEIKDAHDRYGNLEVAFLLQRMESFEGLAILTTNFRQNLDPAFMRRLRFVVEFPRPDADAREKIWRLCLPPASHSLDDAAFRQLARRIDLTGGHIRQITIRAAFIAAAAGSQIELSHIARAARAELAKLGMSPVELDFGDKRRAA